MLVPMSPRADKRRFSARGKIAAIAALSIVCSAWLALDEWSKTHAFMINASQSLPNWAFFVENGRFPERGEYVVFHPGKDALTRQYFGENPQPFAKIAYGVPGDSVIRSGDVVLVNGEEVAQLKPLTQRGDPLIAGPVGVVPEGCVFAATDHRDGFDSRYAHIGFVCRDRLVGVGEPIL